MGKLKATIVSLIFLVFGGGFVAAQEATNPYIDRGNYKELPIEQTLPDAGQARVRIDETAPRATFEKWGGEVEMTVEAMGVQGQARRPALSNRLEYGNGTRQVVMQPTSTGYKIDGVFTQKPNNNVFRFRITGAQNLDFFYQPELTQEEIDDGARRPDNVVGSYAVYHKTKRNHVQGQTNYATGKAFHIYRPKIIDDTGSSTWGQLSYNGGVLAVTVPQNFLDNATYPVTVDPTFGYETIGGSVTAIANDLNDDSFRKGREFTLSEAGSLDSISASLESGTGTGDNQQDVSVFLNREDSVNNTHDEVFSGERLQLQTSETAAFYEFTANSESLTADVYILSAVGNGEDITSDDLLLNYDTGAAEHNYYSESFEGAGSYANAKESPWSEIPFETSTTIQSIYATYTADAGGGGATTATTSIPTIDGGNLQIEGGNVEI